MKYKQPERVAFAEKSIDSMHRRHVISLFGSVAGTALLAGCNQGSGSNSSASNSTGVAAAVNTPANSSSTSSTAATPPAASDPPLSSPSTSPSGMPAAVSNEAWTQKANWTFGTSAGNSITQFTDLLNAGWFMDATPVFLNNECETYTTTNTTNSNSNFQPFSDHCDIVAIWNGGPIASAAGNGSISSLMLRYDMPDGPNATANVIGYYELTCQVPSVGGAWPAWWTIGHPPGTGRGYYTWGPEIDIFEFYNTQTTVMASTLHKGSSVATSYCFMTAGTNPPTNDPPGTTESQYATYVGSESYNAGSINYAPGLDFSQGYHRYGMKIDSNHNISIWVDDVQIGEFAAEQYCDDSGAPVSVELILNLAIGNGSNPVGSIDTSGFAGANNTSATNKFRLSIQKIQIWGP